MKNYRFPVLVEFICLLIFVGCTEATSVSHLKRPPPPIINSVTYTPSIGVSHNNFMDSIITNYQYTTSVNLFNKVKIYTSSLNIITNNTFKNSIDSSLTVNLNSISTGFDLISSSTISNTLKSKINDLKNLLNDTSKPISTTLSLLDSLHNSFTSSDTLELAIFHNLYDISYHSLEYWNGYYQSHNSANIKMKNHILYMSKEAAQNLAMIDLRGGAWGAMVFMLSPAAFVAAYAGAIVAGAAQASAEAFLTGGY